MVQIGARTYDASEIQKLIPQLEETIEKKERQIRQQQSTVETQLKKINELEKEVRTLQSECDKLRSVLDQKAQSVTALSVIQKASWGTEELRTELQQKAVLPTADDGVRSKKMAVSAEPSNLDTQKAVLQHHPKSAGFVQSFTLLYKAILGNNSVIGAQTDAEVKVSWVLMIYCDFGCNCCESWGSV
ncbi:hypothetical protein WUBG_02177 [Wuchereria bancrofti]|uniref:Uncharacterized protein n=1 Tax=Wuchereria bancrofti TaxID=6293 RepID=J9BHT6_WUCBA|nr:hypothetical protein WUBG_02177 [Wuchereria bancrofti]